VFSKPHFSRHLAGSIGVANDQRYQYPRHNQLHNQLQQHVHIDIVTGAISQNMHMHMHARTHARTHSQSRVQHHSLPVHFLALSSVSANSKLRARPCHLFSDNMSECTNCIYSTALLLSGFVKPNFAGEHTTLTICTSDCCLFRKSYNCDIILIIV
jgi:hypothetical protein